MLVGERWWKLRGLQNALANLLHEIDVRKNRPARMLVRVQDADRLFQMAPDQFDGLQQIGVVRYDDADVEFSRVCIMQQVGGQIHVGALFLGLHHFDELRWLSRGDYEGHRDSMGEKVAEMNGHLGQSRQRSQVSLLSHRLVWIIGPGRDQGGEVFDFPERVAG